MMCKPEKRLSGRLIVWALIVANVALPVSYIFFRYSLKGKGESILQPIFNQNRQQTFHSDSTMAIEKPNPRYLFIGGLQRSCTTVVTEALGNLPGYSQLKMSNMPKLDMETKRPWELGMGKLDNKAEFFGNSGGLEARMNKSSFSRILLFSSCQPNVNLTVFASLALQH